MESLRNHKHLYNAQSNYFQNVVHMMTSTLKQVLTSITV